MGGAYSAYRTLKANAVSSRLTWDGVGSIPANPPTQITYFAYIFILVAYRIFSFIVHIQHICFAYFCIFLHIFAYFFCIFCFTYSAFLHIIQYISSIFLARFQHIILHNFFHVLHIMPRPLGLVGKAKAGSSRLTWTAWVQFPPFPRRSLPALLMSSIN